ncbi:MAG: RidA family protein [Ignavibacteria bacterium]|nr:RidA family protein [Ignavibacteria bacterium]
MRVLGFCMLLFILSGNCPAQTDGDVESRLEELGVTLPEPYAPFANYVRAVRSGNLLFLGGHSECTEPATRGKVGIDVTREEAYAAARGTALCLLATLRAELGDLNRIEQVVRVFGMVNAVDSFTEHSQVLNGCSDLLVELLGDRGRHARAAIGVSSLPQNLTVEIEMIVRIRD